MKWVWLALFVLCCLGAVAAWQYVPRDRVREWSNQPFTAYANHVLASQTTHLPPVDRVQVFALQTPEGPLPPGAVAFPGVDGNPPAMVLGTAEVIGIEAEALAALWRSRTFGLGESSRGRPTYGLRFYRGSELIFETSVCWDWDSCTGNLLGKRRHFYFDDPKFELADRLQQIVPVEPAVQAKLEYWRGFQARCNNRLPQAIPAFQRCLELNPGRQSCQYLLAKTHRELGNLHQAITEYDRLLRCEPNEDDDRRTSWLTTLLLQAVLYHETDQPERALSNLEIVFEQVSATLEPEGSALLLAWRIHYERGDDALAESIRARLASEFSIQDPTEYRPDWW